MVNYTISTMILIVRCVTQFNPIWPTAASRERDASCFITVMVLSGSRVNGCMTSSRCIYIVNC